MAEPLEIRNDLAQVLTLDLVGPEPGGAYADEKLTVAPSRYYLSGVLVPHEADEDWKSARDGQEDIDSEEGDGKGDDERTSEKASARKVFFPSSMGLSVCVGPATRSLDLTVSWDDYEPIPPKSSA